MKIQKTTLCVIALFLLAIVIVACGFPRQTTFGVGNEGGLRIIADPSDAEVLVDGASMGPASQFSGDRYIKLTSGTHRIEIRKDGYLPYTNEVFSSNSLQTLEVTLKKM